MAEGLAATRWRLLALALVLLARPGVAKDPGDSISTAVLNVKESQFAFYASSAYDEGWGASLAAQKLSDGKKRAFYPLVYNTSGLTDAFGCTPLETLLNTSSVNVSSSASASVGFSASASSSDRAALGLPDEPFVLLVDRGRCTFADKAYYAQQLGAAVLVVTDTLPELYNRTIVADATTEDRQMEFSCARGSGTAAWDADITDFTADNWQELVEVRSCTRSSKCSSHMCVPSGSGQQVCCAWDIPDLMGFGSSGVVTDESQVSDIAVVRLSIGDGDTLKTLLATGQADVDGQLLVTVYEREPPVVDPAQVILWLLACATVLTGSYKGAAYERTKAQLKAALVAADATSSDATAHARVAYEEHDEQAPAQEQLELTPWHALAFLVIASGFLLLLFFVDVVIVVVVLFGIGAVSTSFQALWEPLLRRTPVPLLRRQPLQNVLWRYEGLLEPALWSVGDLLALILALTLVLVWFFTRFQAYSWVFQDLFGVCLCLVFLRTVRLPNLKVAVVLLLLVFIYDIFMVFVSPYIFHTSVMIKVATGGAQSSATGGVSSGYCLRYPTDTEHNCRSEQMPILLRMPKVLDYRVSSSLLGLGDIVLPGLLLVFCARYDYATRGQLFGRLLPQHGKLLGRSTVFTTTNASDVPGDVAVAAGERREPDAAVELGASRERAPSRRGLFCLLMWGYTLGLLLANVGVVVSGSGQPALMYLVPCTLGLLAIVGWRRGILKQLWDGPPELIPGYKRQDSAANGAVGELDIRETTRLRGLSLEAGKTQSEFVLMQQGEQERESTPLSGGAYTMGEATPTRASAETRRQL